MPAPFKVTLYDCSDTYPDLSIWRLLKSFSTGERAKFAAILESVASAPPRSFSGGGYWEAMHGELDGVFEIRFQGRDRWLFRFFCLLLEQSQPPVLLVFAGTKKRPSSVISRGDYAKVRLLADDLTSANSNPSA